MPDYEWEKWTVAQIEKFITNSYTAKEFCRRAHISRTKLQNMMDNGLLSYARIGNIIYIAKDQGVDVYYSPRTMPLHGNAHVLCLESGKPTTVPWRVVRQRMDGGVV